MSLVRLESWARALRPELDDAALRYARLGFAWICLGDKMPSFDGLAARYLALVPAGQCEVLFDGFGRVAACVSFDWLDPHVEQAVLRHGFTGAPVAPGGGTRPWIVDFIAFEGHVLGALDVLRTAILPHADSVTYFRYKHGRRIAKMVARAELTGRLRRVSAPPPDAAAIVAAYPIFAHGARGILHMAITLGKCMTLAHASGAFAGLSPAQVQHRLWTPITLGQYRFYHDTDGIPVGLATWALLDEYFLARRPALHDLPPEAWNGGTVRRVTDILAASHCRVGIEADHAGTLRYQSAAANDRQEGAA